MNKVKRIRIVAVFVGETRELECETETERREVATNSGLVEFIV